MDNMQTAVGRKLIADVNDIPNNYNLEGGCNTGGGEGEVLGAGNTRRANAEKEEGVKTFDYFTGFREWIQVLGNKESGESLRSVFRPHMR